MKEGQQNVPEALSLIKEINLLNTFAMPNPSVHQTVTEFAANITKAFGDPFHQDYGIVYVRKEKNHYYPDIINKFYGIDEGEEVEYPELGKIVEMLTVGKI